MQSKTEFINTALRKNLFVSIIYNLLIFSYRARKINFLYKVWQFAWKFSLRFTDYYAVTKIHGSRAIVPVGHWYLLVLQNYPKFNHPLLYLVKYSISRKNRPLSIVDVGSAIGDTVLFIEEKYKGVHSFVCIDGDSQYNTIIKHNLDFLDERFTLVNSLVSDKSEKIGMIEKENPTTGSSTSANLADASSLDLLLLENKVIDIIKIDIDGFDGKALAGASDVLKLKSPSIIFEWNVPLFLKTNNDIMLPFESLEKCGYNDYFWFDNFGNFMFYRRGVSYEELEVLAELSVRMFEVSGLHFDVVALKEGRGFIDFVS